MEGKETQTSQSAEKYLNGLSDPDRNNVGTIRRAFLKTMTQRGTSGTLIAVGSSVAGKQNPKDIDLLVVFRGINPAKKGTHLERAVEGYRHLKDFVSEISKETGFKITQEQAPEPDPDIPTVANVDGIITVCPEKGLPIDIVRHPNEESPEEFSKTANRPHVILANV